MLEYLKQIAPDVAVPEEIADMLANNVNLIMIAVLCFAAAIYGYRFFKAVFPVVFSATLVSVAYAYVPALLETIGLNLEVIDLVATVAVVLAILGFVLGRYAYKLSLFLFVGYDAYLGGVAVTKSLAEQYPDVEFFSGAVGELVIGLAAAVILAVLSIFLFKALFIVITSIGGMAITAVCLVDAILPTLPAWYIVIPVGAVVGIVAAVKQFKNNSVYSVRRYR